MTGQQLKNSILQLAIQGRLVAQDPADEPASVLLQRIRQEKQRLVKEGTLKKKDLTSTPITEEDKPFDIPETWEWCRIGDISSSFIGLTYSPSDVSEEGTLVLRSSNIKNGKLCLLDQVRVKKDIPEKLIVNNNDILICARNGSKKLVGKSAIIRDAKEPMTFGAFMAICKTPFYEFVYQVLQSDLFYSQLRGVSGTTTINQLTQNNFNNFLIPLPPLSEQRRIVARIEELMPLVEAYGKAQEELELLNAGLPEALKKSILQEAIQGRLVPQDANDEPASVLLARIRKEKEQLVKAGKLKKKDLTSTPITEEEKPFDIPETWEWCRLGEILSPMETKKPQGDFFDYIDIDAVDNKKQIVGHPKHLAVSEAPSRASRKLHSGDVIYSMVRPYLRNIAIINEEHKDCIASTGFYVCSPFEGLSTKYLYRFLLSPYFTDGMHLLMKGDNSPSINAADLQGYLIPLPPLSEQRRIVAKIETLFAAIDQMKALH